MSIYLPTYPYLCIIAADPGADIGLVLLTFGFLAMNLRFVFDKVFIVAFLVSVELLKTGRTLATEIFISR